MARIFYYKTLLLADWVQKRESVSIGGDPAIFGQSTYASTAPVEDQGANSSYTVNLDVLLYRGFSGAETVDAFVKRQIQFSTSLKNIKPEAGHFVVIADDDTDATTCTGSVAAGSPATIPLAADIALSAGELAFISNGTSYEIITVGSYQESPAEISTSTTIALSNGDPVCRLNWYLPNCYLMGEITVGGEEGAGNQITNAIALTLQGVDDPVYQT